MITTAEENYWIDDSSTIFRFEARSKNSNLFSQNSKREP